MGVRQAAGSCPPEVLERAGRWGVSREWVTRYWQHFGPHFNLPTVAQAMVLYNVVGTEKPISVRGAFYRAVSRGVYRDTGVAGYRQVIGLLLKLRRAGLVPYSWVSDTTRRSEKPSSWAGPQSFVESMASVYRRDLWGRQEDYVELFVEKDAMSGVLSPVTREYDVALNIIRGDASETFVWSVADRWQRISKPIHVGYLGDADPKGFAIEQNLRDRIEAMAGKPAASWTRLGVTPEEMLAGRFVSFAIKGDRRAKAWRTKNAAHLQRFGDRCVEVDAIPAPEVRERLRGFIELHIEQDEWRRLKAVEAIEKQSLKDVVLGQLLDTGSEREEPQLDIDEAAEVDEADEAEGDDGQAAPISSVVGPHTADLGWMYDALFESRRRDNQRQEGEGQ